MSKFVTHSGDRKILHSMVILLPIYGNMAAAKDTLNSKLESFASVSLSQGVNFEDDHVEFTIVSEENICKDFYRAYKDGLKTAIIKSNVSDEFKRGVEESKSVVLEILLPRPEGKPILAPESISFHRFNVNVTAVRDLLTVKHWKYLERQYNIMCIIKTNDTTKECILFCETTIENKENADIFEEYIRNIVNDPVNFMEEVERQKSKKIHIFVDVSNIAIGIQKLSDGTWDRSLKLNVKNLSDVIKNIRTVVSAVAVGSSKEGPSVAIETSYWKIWKQCGFKPIILQRGIEGEQAVDEVLHAQIATEAHKKYPEERTLVILTGDGNDNHDHGTSFPQIIENAMRNDWTVEVWSWSQSTSRNYQIYRTNYPH
eukprot:gene7695-15750_t